MSNELKIFNDTTIAFGRKLEFDIFNTVEQIDNDTVIIKPRYNTSGLTELKVKIYKIKSFGF